MPTSTPTPDAGDTAPNQRRETLRLGALDQASGDTVRRRDEEDSQRIAVSAAPAR